MYNTFIAHINITQLLPVVGSRNGLERDFKTELK